RVRAVVRRLRGRRRLVAVAAAEQGKAGDQGDGVGPGHVRWAPWMVGVRVWVASVPAWQVDAAGNAAVVDVAASGRAHGEVAARAVDVDVARADRADRDAAADVVEVEVAGTDRPNVHRAAGGVDRHVAGADAPDPRSAADVADGRVSRADRSQVQRTDVAGLQVAGAERRGEFAADAGGPHVAR